MAGEFKDTRGRNGFLGVLAAVVAVSWYGSSFGNRTPAGSESLESLLSTTTMPAEVASEPRINEPDGELTLAQDYQLRLSNNYRFDATLEFSHPMDAESAAEFFEFSDPSGQLTAATLSPVDGHPKRLRVRPSLLLGGGREWQMRLKSGLVSADGTFVFRKDKNWELGSRVAPAVKGAWAENGLNYQRKIHVDFARALPPDLKAEDYSRWVVLEKRQGDHFVPVKDGFTLATKWRGIILNGQFALNTNYRIRIKEGLPTRLGLSLPKSWAGELRFRPLPGQVYLTDTATSQAVEGNRSFSFVSVNNRTVRLRVKRVEPNQAFRVIRSYYQEYLGRRAFGWSGNNWKERKRQPVSFDLVPGELVCQRIIPVRAKTDEAVKQKYVWDDLLEDAGPGTLLVELESIGVDGSATVAQSLVQLTDIGLVWKEGSGSIFFHALGLQSARPIAKASIRVLDEAGKSLAAIQADDLGSATIPMPPGRGERWVEVVADQDRHYFQLNSGFSRIPLWSYDVQTWSARSGENQLHLFTDRDVYQPGGTVYLKGHARSWRDGQLMASSQDEFEVTLTGPRGRVHAQETVQLTADGAFDTALRLPTGVNGSFRIRAGQEQLFVNAMEYEPATFQVAVQGDGQFGPDESVKVPVGFRYYFGEPLARASVEWTFSAHSFRPEFDGWEDYQFGFNQDVSVSQTGKGKLNKLGQFVVEPDIPAADGQQLRGSLYVHCTDISGQTVSRGISIRREGAGFYLGLKKQSRIFGVGERLPLKVIGINPKGRVLSEGVPLVARLFRVEWRTLKIKSAGGGVRYENEKQLVPVGEVNWATTQPDAEPKESQLRPDRAGQYQLEVIGEDLAGRSLLTQTEFFVSGKRPLAWDYSTEFKMDLVPDSESYHPGETARILLKAPLSGRALVSLERGKVLRTFQLDVSGNAPVIEVPLNKLDVPNVYVSVMLFRGADASTRRIPALEYRMGYCRIDVVPQDSRLTVAAQLEKSDYQPGDEVTASVQVNTASGDPVGGAGVTLFAVDQGVLDLTGYQPPDLHAYFYTPKPLRVSTSTSIPFMRSEDPGQVRFANKGQIIGGGGLGKIRQKFQAVAFWSADIKTDIHGRVQAVFKAPDSLTCYRLFAVVHHGARFGMGKTAFRVYRPLMVESALPRFGRVGDKVIAKAIIFNQSAKPLNVVARLELDDLLQSERPTERRITVPAAGQVDVRFPIQFVAQGRSRTVWRVRSEKQVALQDARKSWIDIRPVMPMRDIHHFVRTTGPMLDILGKIPEELREAEGALEISVSTSPMAGLEEASEYLLDYPHGCAEQTSSRLIPWLLLEKHGDLFPRLQMPKGRSAADPVTHGINRLLSMQTHDGGLSYWPAGRADPFASAYGGMVLAIARLQGKTVPVGSLDALATYLNKQARALPKDAYHWGMHCLSLYTLTLLDCPQPSLHERAFQERENIPADARALLAAAVRQVGGPDAMVQSLLKQSGTKAGAFAYYGNENQQQAMRLMAVAGAAEAAVLVDRLIHSARRGHWGSTFANAWTLLGMAAVEKSGSGHRIACEIFDGKNHHQIRLDSNQRKVTVRLTDIKGPVSFTGPAGQPVFIGVKARLRPTKVASEPIARGMQLKRTYQSLTRPGSEEWQVGDLVRVRLALTVEPDAVHWVALEDGLPAVLEPVLGDLLTQQTGENLAQSWRVNHHILQKDRAVFYMNRLPRGVHNVEYLARVRSEGEVALPPGQAQAMYDPDVVALTIGGRREAKRPHD